MAHQIQSARNGLIINVQPNMSGALFRRFASKGDNETVFAEMAPAQKQKQARGKKQAASELVIGSPAAEGGDPLA